MRPIKAILFEPACLSDAEGPFEDVAPALTELKAMGIQLLALPNRDREGVATNADPAETLYVTDNAEGLTKARAAGMIPILLMHDPDEAMRLVANNPAGGVVSLLELPDLIRYVAANPAPLPSPLHAAP
jgi:phosphoglycolate phosphatase-like HAD superfamily hydrolase